MGNWCPWDMSRVTLCVGRDHHTLYMYTHLHAVHRYGVIPQTGSSENYNDSWNQYPFRTKLVRMRDVKVVFE